MEGTEAWWTLLLGAFALAIALHVCDSAPAEPEAVLTTELGQSALTPMPHLIRPVQP